MGTAIIIFVLIVIILCAILSIRKRIKYGSACCGTHDAAPKKIRVQDKNKSHYPYTYILTVDGMHCSNCATVKLENNTVLVRSKNTLEWDDLSPLISHEGYTLIKLTSE